MEALVQEGKQLLREGRQLTKTGFDLGGADLALQDAMACFEEAAQIDSTSIKVQVAPDIFHPLSKMMLTAWQCVYCALL